MGTTKTGRVKKATTKYVESLEYQMMPRDGGQIVEVTYACDEDGVWCRIYDRSDQRTSYQYAKYYARATLNQMRHEPWNGILPRHNSWVDVKLI